MSIAQSASSDRELNFKTTVDGLVRVTGMGCYTSLACRVQLLEGVKQEHYHLRSNYKLTITVAPCATTSHWRDQLDGARSRSRLSAFTVAVQAVVEW